MPVPYFPLGVFSPNPPFTYSPDNTNNATGSSFDSGAPYSFGQLDTVGVGVEIHPVRVPGAAAATSEAPRIFFVCNGSVVAIAQNAQHAAGPTEVWPVIGCSNRPVRISSNFGSQPFVVSHLRSSSQPHAFDTTA